ncbi:ADAMTS-like protein 2 isoform X1 [Lissotriton helveticus]
MPGGARLLPPLLLLSLWPLPLHLKDSSEVSEDAAALEDAVSPWWWGEWSSWSTCSRTCGGGVMSQERHCLRQRLGVSPGLDSTVCQGQTKQYQLCQEQACPADAISFKQHQCASFNGKAFGKHYYIWTPLYPDDYTSISNKPCDLQCTTVGGERQLMVPAQDGTSCKDRAYQGVCISGKCEAVGCDGRLHSSRTMDRCRVCGGDGSACFRVSGSFRKGISQLGYALITHIPAGALDILIIERRKTENILALSDVVGNFFINGNTAIDNPQNFRIAGTLIKYRRPSTQHAEGLEYIMAQGPINQSLNVMYYNFNGKLPHITYEYTVPRTPASVYNLDVPPYSHHSTSHLNAVDLDPPDSASSHNSTWLSQAEASRGFTQNGDEDFNSRQFNWANNTGDWKWIAGDEVFNSRGRNYHTNQVGGQEKEEDDQGAEGGDEDGGHLELQVNHIPMSTARPVGPLRSRKVGSRIRASRLRYFWRLCHRGDRVELALCRGIQHLAAILARRNSTGGFWGALLTGLAEEGDLHNRHEKMNALGMTGTEGHIITGAKLADEDHVPEVSEDIALMVAVSQDPVASNATSKVQPLQATDTDSNDFDVNPLGQDISVADMYRWKVSAHAPCSSSCASGFSSSYAMCVRYDGVEVDEAHCDSVTRPEPTHEFCSGRECQPRWETSRWSECSRTCGEGVQVRSVRCWKMMAPGFDSSVYNQVCEAEDLVRPMERKVCKSKACGPQWELSEWSECSAPCGSTGVMRREVRCSVESHLCDEEARPISEKECTGPPCDWQWTASDWGPCSGQCGEGRMIRHIDCKNMEGEVIANSQCDQDNKPLAVHPCGGKNCPAHWVEQQWEQCNASCGRGEKTRRVVCAGLEHGAYKEYPEERCDLSSKPEVLTACFRRPCSTWFTTSWSQCSATCGAGQQVREVKCYQGEQLGQGCDPESKPEARQTCELQPCPTEAPDEDCEDKPTANCVLVLRVKLCSHWYYRKACCRACRGKVQ